MQFKRSTLYTLILFICLIGIHYEIDRSNSLVLLTAYSLSFLSYVLLIIDQNLPFKFIVFTAICIRVSLFFSFPSLSDDFYRFIWDGELLTHGLNSFDHTPVEIMSMDISIDGIEPELFDKLNSKIYATIYPPISQLIFWIGARFSNSIFEAVTILRFIILLFEVATIGLLTKTLGNNKSKIAIYALNPLVILELTGNIHFEGVMLFFLLLTVYLLKKSPKVGSLALSMSIATKLIPLMILPSLIKFLGFKKAIISYTLIGLTLALMFSPLLSTAFLGNFGSSLNLFFQSFEFNSGIFFLLRQIGFWIVNYDMVATIGPGLSIVSLGLILFISLNQFNNSSNPSYWYVIIFFIQLIFSTTVHPWYVIPMLGLSITSGFRFPILWSFLIFYSYIGYDSEGYQQPMLVIYIEYFLVISYAFYEIIKSPKYLVKSNS